MRKIVGTTVLLFGFFGCGGSDEASDTPVDEVPQVEAPSAETPENLQIVQVTVEGDAYVFSPAKVQAGLPVQLVFDSDGLPGCSRDVAIPDFGIAKVISAADATIEFTPEAPGPISIACSMDMYRGTLVAE